MSKRLACAKDLQALRRRRASRARSPAGRTRLEGQNIALAFVQGHAGRGEGGAQRTERVGAFDRIPPRAGAVPGRRDDGGAHRRSRRGPLGDAEVAAAIDRGSGTRAGPTRSRRSWAPESGRGPLLRFHRAGPAGVVGIVAPDEPPRSAASLAPRTGDRRRKRGRRVASETHPVAAIELAEALATSDLPGGMVHVLTGFERSSRPGSPVTGTWTRSTSPAPPDPRRDPTARRRRCQACRAELVSRCSEPVGDRILPRVQDDLASDRQAGIRAEPGYRQDP